MAVFTNVTSDHLDRHGTLEAYRAVKRRFAELVDPDGALVLNLDDPVTAGYAGLGRRADRPLPARPAASRAASASSTAGSSPTASSASAAAPAAPAASASRGPGLGDGPAILPVAELRAARPAQRLERARRGRRRAPVRRAEPTRSGRPPPAFRGVEHRLETVAVVDGVRFVNDSQGTQPDAVIAALRAFDPPIVLIAGGRDKGVDLTELGPVVAERAAAAVLIGESGPGLEHRFRAAGLARTERAATLEAAVRRAAAIAAELRDRPGRPAPRSSRRSCSARPRRASTCSRTTRRAAGRSRPPSRRLAEEGSR